MDPSECIAVVLAADFTAAGDLGRRLAQEIRALAGQGAPLAMLQTVQTSGDAQVAEEIRTCLRRGLARLITADEARRGTARLILHAPASASAGALGLPWERLEEVAVICHAAADLRANLPLPPAVTLRWHPLHNALRPALRKAGKTQGATWHPVPASCVPQPRRGRVAIGWIGAGPSGTWPTQIEHFRLDDSPVSLDRLVSDIDILALREPADTLVASMLASGRTVIAHPSLRHRYGAGLAYRRDLAAALREVLDGATANVRVSTPDYLRACRTAPVLAYGKDAGKDAGDGSPRRQGPILFLSSNGVGIGHLTRLLAIARQIGPAAPVVFATQAQAVGVVESFGYPVDYIPSPGAVGGDFARWDDWFAAHLAMILDRHDPAIVVYDGNHPSDGLIRAVAARRDCRLVWIRRAMWGRTTSDAMHNARWCDLVIEPGELAASYDTGITTTRRDEATHVAPIRLLDPGDLLPREEAAGHIGLDPSRPAVLLQLGSGYQRDLLSMLDQIIRELASQPRLQVCVAEWVNGTIPLTLWPEVTVLRGFPLTQYIRAFDFCISAAGYNSFHELVGCSVPTIFVANRHPSMDDQYARARFAQDHAAAFELSEHDLHDLPALITMMMQPPARRYLSDRCSRLAQGNGAAEAARALLDLLGPQQALAMAAE